jgi:putative nucleotidyltransferase with HDIG domain
MQQWATARCGLPATLESVWMPAEKKATRKAATASTASPRARGSGGHRLAAAFEAVEHFPALGEPHRRLQALCASPNPASDEIAETIEADPALAAAVMRAANSPAGEGRGRVFGVPQAVEVLAPSGIETAIAQLRTYELFELGNGWRGLPARFRGHAVATRAASEQIGTLIRMPAQDELSLAALLHDIGKLVLDRLHPAYSRPQADGERTPEKAVWAERRQLGIDHALVGGVLTRRWGFPDRIASAIERHHSEDVTGTAAAVRLADLVAHHAAGGTVDPEVVTTTASELGLEHEQLHSLFYEYPYVRTVRRRSSDPCPLSTRELDALRGLASGKVYKEIAGEMSLSASTVRTHLHNVYRKIGTVDRAQAVLVARDRGWI